MLSSKETCREQTFKADGTTFLYALHAVKVFDWMCRLYSQNRGSVVTEDVRAASFINRKGKAGKNKPADMEKENQIKFLKDLIRDLGKGKTEAAVVNISRAEPVFRDLSLTFDEIVGLQTPSSKHQSVISWRFTCFFLTSSPSETTTADTWQETGFFSRYFRQPIPNYGQETLQNTQRRPVKDCSETIQLRIMMKRKIQKEIRNTCMKLKAMCGQHN